MGGLPAAAPERAAARVSGAQSPRRDGSIPLSDVDATTLSKPGITHELVSRLVQYKQEILGLYCSRLGLKVTEAGDALAVLTTGLILTQVSTQDAKTILRPYLEAAHLLGPAEPCAPVYGFDILQHGDITALLPSSRFSRSHHMIPEFADDLRAWLYEADQQRRRPSI